MSKKIFLTNGAITLVSPEDYLCEAKISYIRDY